MTTALDKGLGFGQNFSLRIQTGVQSKSRIEGLPIKGNWSGKIPHAAGQLSPLVTTTEVRALEVLLCNEKLPQ